MYEIENKLFKRQLGPKTQKWTEISEVNDAIKNEEERHGANSKKHLFE